ncbi:MAG: hypothetical protein WAU45_21545 [Blastocatellia bacterium]
MEFYLQFGYQKRVFATALGTAMCHFEPDEVLAEISEEDLV